MARTILLGALLLFGFSMLATAQETPVAKGIQVYTAQKCGLCHSIAGKGNAKGPLDGIGSKLSDGDLRNWMVDAKGMAAKAKSQRKPEMKNYTLPKGDLDALVAYMLSLKK